jgi:hypothetical protein
MFDRPGFGIMSSWTLPIPRSNGWFERSRAHGARWLSIIFAPEDPHLPWSVSIDEGRGGDATTAHGSTLAEALRMRLTK